MGRFLRHSPKVGLVRLLLILLLAVVAAGPRPAFAASFTVNSTADTVDAAPGNGVCADASNNCTLRAAIMETNALAGADTITLPAGTFTLTRAGSDDTSINGDLDVTGPLTINGAGVGSTILQAGTTNSNGIDKILSFNPLGVGAGFAVSVNNLTLRFGKNPETYANGNGFGGCFDFDSGTSGVGSLTMSNVTASDCQTTEADGGGGAIFLTSGGTVSLTNTTIQNNTAHRISPNFAIGGGLFFGCAGGSGATVTLSNSTVTSNHALDSGAQGGGLFLFGACSGTPPLNYQLHAVTISNNQANNDGGGIYSTAPLTIDNTGGATTISGNSSGRSGGGVWLNHTNRTSTISKVTITGNSAVDGGGGIRLDSSNTGNVLNLSYSRIVNNTAGSGKATGLSVNNGTANATNNWWGCSTGPSATPCDTTKVDPGSGGGPPGTGTVTFNPWLRVLTTANPATIVTNQSTSLSANVNTNSNGQDVSANNQLLRGLPVVWSAVGGNLSGQQGTIQPDGTASASYQATAANVSNKAAAKVDNDGTTTGSNVALITVNRANTTTAITSDTPDPSVTGQTITVTFILTGSNGNSPTVPTGNVTVSDGVNSCVGTVAAGQCAFGLFNAGNRTLTATYAGDSNFNTSTSGGAAHLVNKANTTTTILSDNPDPSVVGQAVTVQYTVTANLPGAGTPTGNVTISDGTISCVGTVAAGQCSLTFPSAGTRTLTAAYVGDSNYNSSTSVTASHQVNPANTTTTILSDNPDPSVVGQAVTVQYTVTVNLPGAGTPTGNVTVSDGVNSCVGTVAAGQCSLTFPSAGTRTLTGTYAGDSNFNTSTSVTATHQVNLASTTTTILSDNPDPSVVGQGVTVQYTVTVNLPGAGTPTGNVTISDGTTSCIGTVAAGQCNLAFPSAGTRTLTATYAGDSNFAGSASPGEPHTAQPALLVGHVTWQARPAQPNALNQLPITLTLRLGANAPITYSNQTTDASGFFTVPVSTLPTGVYTWWVKGPSWLATSGAVSLTGAFFTQQEMGLQRAGDVNNDNLVDVTDFSLLRATFGLLCGNPGFDARADFTGDCVVDVTDFNWLRTNFNQTGPPPP